MIDRIDGVQDYDDLIVTEIDVQRSDHDRRQERSQLDRPYKKVVILFFFCFVGGESER